MAKRTIITKEQELEIVKLYTIDKLNMRKIKKIFHTSDERIRDILITAGIPVRKQIANLTPTEQENICELYKTQSSIEIGKLLNINDSTILGVLKRNDISRRQVKVHEFNENYFEKIDSFDKAYFLGLLFADGNVSNNFWTSSIGLHIRDTHILETFKKYIEFKDPLYIKPSRKDIVYLKINSVKLSNDLNNLGCIPNKSLILDWPINLPKEFVSHFIRGYFDGDGSLSSHIHKGERRAAYALNIMSSVIFIRRLIEVIKNEIGLDIKYKIIKNNKTAYMYICNYKKLLGFLGWIYKDSLDCKINRKFERYQIMLNFRGTNFIKYIVK